MEQKGSHRFKRTNMLLVVALTARMLLLFNAIPLAQTADGPITCKAGTFTYGEPASIDCNFRTNITASKLDLSMTKYLSNAPKGDTGKDILMCPWDKEQKTHDCSIVMANYTFDILTDHLMVRIPAINFQQAGWYKCYFVPTEEFQPQACELLVQERPESTSTAKPRSTSTANTDEPEESQTVLPIVLPCVIVVLVGVCIVGIVLFMRRRRANRARKSMGMELHHRSKTTELLLPDEKQQVDKLSEVFQLSQTSLQNVVNVLEQEMQAGLHSSTQRSADTGMFRTFVSPLPTASDFAEIGHIMVFQLRSNHLIVQCVIFPSTEVECPTQTFRAPNDYDFCEKLFDFIAKSAETFVQTNQQFLKYIHKKKKELNKEVLQMPVAFVFAFPCKHETLSKAHLTKWTKEFKCKDVMRKDIKQMLQQALKKTPGLTNLKIVAIVNDTVSTLVSVASSDPQCKVALHVGNGLNACYVEDDNSTGADGPEVINTELGGLWNKANLDSLRTVYDKELDENSADPGSQILEKMVSWMYIGEIVRQVLKRLKHDGKLFPSMSQSCVPFKLNSFSPENVMIFESDTEESFSKRAGILQDNGIKEYTDEDLQIIRDVCRLVCERSAFLAAAGLAALINHVNQPGITIFVDGILWWDYSSYHDQMYSKTRELVKPGLTFSLVSPPCDKSIGAARIAAASLRLRNTKKSKK